MLCVQRNEVQISYKEGCIMQITDEEKQLIRDNLHYIPATGTILWSDDSKYRPFIGAPVPMTSEQVGGKEALTVWIGDQSFAAADVCWFLWKGRWPAHGVIFADKSKAGRKDLSASNLRLRRRPEYVKKGRAVWVPRTLANDIVTVLAKEGYDELHLQMNEVLTKGYKR